MRELFEQREVARLVGIPEAQVRRWASGGAIPPVQRDARGRLWFDFKALVAFRRMKQLRQQGLSPQRIRRCVEQLRRIFPQLEQPLAEVKVSVVDGRLLFDRGGLKFDAGGQLVLDFSPQRAGSLAHLPAEPQQQLLLRGIQHEERGELEEAWVCYARVLQIDPEHADALVNMGNLEYRWGASHRAEALYRRALRVDPDHPQANYNLANLLEERGQLEDALLFYRKAIQEAPDFADAHFNLARVLERLGERDEARRHWRIYLELDPQSPWAEYARSRLRDGP